MVRPSDLRKVGYCPTMYFFEVFVKGKPPLILRVKALWGRLLHAIHHTIRLSWVNEELLKAPVEELRIVLVGKPDSYKFMTDELIVVEEFKSRRAPKGAGTLIYDGAWISDALQLMAYGYILSRVYGKKVKLKIRYIDKSVEIRYDEDILLKRLSLLRDIVEGVFPDPEWVSRNKCRRCPYREFCPFSPFSPIAFT